MMMLASVRLIESELYANTKYEYLVLLNQPSTVPVISEMENVWQYLVTRIFSLGTSDLTFSISLHHHHMIVVNLIFLNLELTLAFSRWIGIVPTLAIALSGISVSEKLLLVLDHLMFVLLLLTRSPKFVILNAPMVVYALMVPVLVRLDGLALPVIKLVVLFLVKTVANA